MNKRLFLGLAMIAACSVQAQPISLFNKEKKPHTQLVQNILNRQQHSGLLRPTTIQQRVVAMASASNGQTDSIAYTYTGVHGSVFNHNAVALGFVTNFEPSYAPMVNINVAGTYSEDLEADSINYFSNGDFVYSEQAAYNADDKIDSVTTFAVPSPESKINTVYNSSGLLEEIIYSDISGSEPMLDEKRKIVYNDNGSRQIADTLFDYEDSEWVFSEYRSYGYDDEGKLVSVHNFDIFDPTEPYISMELLYNGDGLLSVTNVYWGVVDPEHLFRTDSISYAPGSNLVEEFKDYLLEQDGATATKITRSFGDNGLADTVRFSMLSMVNGWEEWQTSLLSYNDFDNPELIISYVPGIDGPASELQFYYEEYDDETGIEALAGTETLRLYPNPFLDEVHFELPESGQPFTATVYNILGQQVFKRQIKARAGKQTLNLSELSPGNYLFQVVNENGKIYNSKIVK